MSSKCSIFVVQYQKMKKEILKIVSVSYGIMTAMLLMLGYVGIACIFGLVCIFTGLEFYSIIQSERSDYNK